MQRNLYTINPNHIAFLGKVIQGVEQEVPTNTSGSITQYAIKNNKRDLIKNYTSHVGYHSLNETNKKTGSPVKAQGARFFLNHNRKKMMRSHQAA